MSDVVYLISIWEPPSSDPHSPHEVILLSPGTVIFNTLSKPDIEKIILLEIAKLEKRIGEIGYKIKLDKLAIDYLCEVGYDAKYGARPLSRAIQKYVEDSICDEILNERIKEGQLIKISYNMSSIVMTK